MPWVASNQKMIPTEALPTPVQRAEQARAAADALVKGGYVRIGIDHFALPGDTLAEAAKNGALHRNFQGYTPDASLTLIGIGATSIGRTPSGYVQNISETGAYMRAVAAGKLPVARGHAFKDQDELRAHVIERIMCDGKVDLTAAGSQFGVADDWYANRARGDRAAADRRRHHLWQWPARADRGRPAAGARGGGGVRHLSAQLVGSPLDRGLTLRPDPFG
ncbi:MAG: hypothetical protein MZV49_24745 [Rhodopseudomonas palustris]|nr:hypothetical protein [Rhodopseudomonas palustris]